MGQWCIVKVRVLNDAVPFCDRIEIEQFVADAQAAQAEAKLARAEGSLARQRGKEVEARLKALRNRVDEAEVVDKVETK